MYFIDKQYLISLCVNAFIYYYISRVMPLLLNLLIINFPNILYLLHSIFLYNYFGLIFDQYIPSHLALFLQEQENIKEIAASLRSSQ